ncbi:MAG: AAA family ATPase [Actinomycetota bacterium]|nr:AAA family ATPase [Actinomycetota bacterium]
MPALILVGPPGSGKSTVGRAVADQLRVPFRDFDDDVRDAHGIEAGELVVELGRERFQEVEVELLRTVLADCDGVLALGGGTPTAPGAADLLAGAPVVFLDVDLENLLRREGLVPLHPWLMPNPRAQLRQLLTERRPVYQSVSQATVLTSGRPVEDVVADVLVALSASAS